MSYPSKLTLVLLMSAGAISAQASAADKLASAKALTMNHCAACHTFGKGEPAGQGPNLFGVLGRKAGSADGFTYSEGFKKAMAGKTWDAQLLNRWLADTQAVAPGSYMVYFQDDPAKRRAIVQYLDSLH